MAAGPVDCHCHLSAPCFQPVRRLGAGGRAGRREPAAARPGAEALRVSCRMWRPWCGRPGR